MDRYRKFSVDMTAVIVEMNRLSGAAKNGHVPVNVKLLQEAVRLASNMRSSMNHTLEFKLDMELKRNSKRFGLVEAPEPKPAAKPVAKPETEEVLQP